MPLLHRTGACGLAWPRRCGSTVGETERGRKRRRERERKRQVSPPLLSPCPGFVAIFTLRSGRVRCRAKKKYTHTHALFSPFSLPASLPPSAPDFSPYAGAKRAAEIRNTHTRVSALCAPPPRLRSAFLSHLRSPRTSGRRKCRRRESAPLQDEWT